MHIKILMLDPLGRNSIFQASRTGGCCITKISGEPILCPYRTQDKSEARMLTRTQIGNATTEELERLQARIEAELEGRRAEERDHEGGVEIPESRETPAGTFRWQMRECGHKDRCNKCKGGERHGPYLYRFYYRNGKRRSEYIPLKKARALGLERPPVPR
jgi:hypothetical protein